MEERTKGSRTLSLNPNHLRDLQKSTLEKAFEYLSMGLSVIPTKKGTKEPALDWKEFQERLPTKKEIETWFSSDSVGIAIVWGNVSGGSCCLDFDGEGWQEIANDFIRRFPWIDVTLKVETGSGKLHLWFKCSDLPKEITKLIKKFSNGQIELRANGHYVLVPPSLHPCGKSYCFINPGAPVMEMSKQQLDEVIAWFKNTNLDHSRGEEWQEEFLEGVQEGGRHNAIIKLAGRYAAKRLSRSEALGLLLNINSTYKPPLPTKEIEDVLDYAIKTHPQKPMDEPIERIGITQGFSPFQRAQTWPSPLREEAFYGLVGKFVKLIEPRTEADPVALLIQVLTAFGNVVGLSPFFQVEADRHKMKIFPVLVGETSKGRKGTSLGYAKHIFKQIDEEWTQGCIKGGLSSGEGLIYQVRDPIKRNDPIKEKQRVVGYQEIVVDPGITDKRLLVVEPEFASPLRAIGREGNLLSPTIRQAWDGEDLRVLTKNSPIAATGAHISIIGHISRDELKRYLDRTEIANGFANRFIFLCVRRSKTLPEGGGLYGLNLESITKEFKETVEFGRMTMEIRKDGQAMQMWAEVYPELSAGKPGLFGEVISRAEAQVMRLACLYALLDKSEWVRKEHLSAALALWDYSEASARYIFGDATGDVVADRILQAARGSADGLTRTDISNLFLRNVSGERIESALSFLESHGLMRVVKQPTQGRPTERWMIM